MSMTRTSRRLASAACVLFITIFGSGSTATAAPAAEATTAVVATGIPPVPPVGAQTGEVPATSEVVATGQPPVPRTVTPDLSATTPALQVNPTLAVTDRHQPALLPESGPHQTARLVAWGTACVAAGVLGLAAGRQRRAALLN